MSTRTRRLPVVLAVLAAAAWLAAAPAAAHDIPADVTARLFVRPDGRTLHYLARIPMASIIDVEWPLVRADGTLDIARLDPFLRDAARMWIEENTDVFEGAGRVDAPILVAARLSLPSDPSFDSYEDAARHVTAPPLPESTRLLPTQGMLDAQFDYAISADGSPLSIHPRLARLGIRVTTILSVAAPGQRERRLEYQGGDPGRLRLQPAWSSVAAGFTERGFFAALDSIDLLLLLFCLLVPFCTAAGRREQPAAAMTAFAAAETLAIAAAAFGLTPRASWFPPLVATLAPAAILYWSVENGMSVASEGARWLRRREPAAYLFGFLAGFIANNRLAPMLQFAGGFPSVGAAAFGFGMLAAQLLSAALVIVGASLLLRTVAERPAMVVFAAMTGHAAWHWTLDRFAELRRFPIPRPEVDVLLLAAVLRALMIVVLMAAGVWLIGVLRPATGSFRSSRP